MKKKALVVVMVLLVSLVLNACGTASASETVEADVTVKIAYLPITHSLAVLEEAELLESNEDVQIELVKYGSWPELLDALNSGQVDGASVLIELAMKSKAEGVGIKAVALGHRDGNVIVVSNDISDGSDLQGKTIAIPHRLSSHNILLQDALAEYGLTIDDINVVELAPTEMPSALASGTIDGYCVAEPFGAMGVSIGAGKVLYESADLWEDSICCALVLTDAFLEEHADAADTVIAQYQEAGSLLSEEEALDVASSYLSQSEDVLETSLQWISYDDLTITEDMYDDLCAKVTQYGLMDETPSYTEFVYTAE